VLAERLGLVVEFVAITAAVMALPFARIVLDGEAVAHCPKGLPDYSRSARRVVLREPSQAWRELSTRPLKQHRGVGDENDVRAAPQLVSGECAALDALQDAPSEAIGKLGDKVDIRHSGTDTDRKHDHEP
jgi:hypothetical protein